MAACPSRPAARRKFASLNSQWLTIVLAFSLSLAAVQQDRHNDADQHERSLQPVGDAISQRHDFGGSCGLGGSGCNGDFAR